MCSPALHRRTQSSGTEGKIGHYQLRSYHPRPSDRLWYVLLPLYLTSKLMSVAIGATLEHVPNGWRWMVGLGALPGILQLSTLHLLPESRMSSLPPNRSC
jgi:hypothetical protein